MSTNNVIYSRDSISYHAKVLATPFDGSEANRHAKNDAANYLRGWIRQLLAFAQLSDTRASEYCKIEAGNLQAIIKNANSVDGILW